MSRAAYTYWDCPLCGKTMRGHGLAKVNHQRKHVREGKMREIKPDTFDGRGRVNYYGVIRFEIIRAAPVTP